MTGSISLAELNRRITRAVTAAPGLVDVWVTAETSDVRTSGGHCYMELLQKDDGGRVVAKSRAVIWATAFSRIAVEFFAATGSQLRSDMKVLVQVSVNFHAVYGFTLVIKDIDPAYTAGDLVRRRNEIIKRLKDEGVFDLNSTLRWTAAPQRVAVISAPGAAGYGDFIKHLHQNPQRLSFSTRLFPAVMQGVNTVASVIAALEAVMENVDDYDCVVLIRGGGAVSDLASFDDYELAAHVAQFPLPVIVGIGHERDVTVLDYVANTRVKTPTAAAEALIGRLGATYNYIRQLGREIMNTVAERVTAERRQLAYYEGNLPALTRNVLDRARRRTGRDIAGAITVAVRNILRRERERLAATGELLEALAPEATLRRGYSITRFRGRAVTDASAVPRGSVIVTTVAEGEIISTVKSEDNDIH